MKSHHFRPAWAWLSSWRKIFTPLLKTHPALQDIVEILKRWQVRCSSDSTMLFRCITAIFLDHCCIVIDLIFSAKAFIVPYHGIYESMPYMTPSRCSQRRRYHYIPGPNGNKMLTMEKVDGNDAAVQFSKIDYDTALQQITLRTARKNKFEAPNTKHVVTRSLMSE